MWFTARQTNSAGHAMEEVKLVNRVAASGLITLDPAQFLDPSPVSVYDLKDNLFQGMILREKDFREFLKGHDWSQYEGHLVSVICSADAIIPTWAYMLLAAYFQPVAKKVIFGDTDTLNKQLIQERIMELDLSKYKDKRVVVKGCGDSRIPESVYFDLSILLKPIVKSLMFGEPCSTVPIYKNS